MSTDTTIARPYAKASFATALQENQLQRWTDLLQTTAFIMEQKKVIEVIKNPKFSTKEHYEWIASLCESILFPSGSNFLKLLAEYRRLALLPDIAKLFEIYRAEQEKIAQVEVTTPFTLSSAEQTSLAETLKNRFKKNVVLNYQIDESLLGGMIIRSGDLVIDSSVRGKLERLNTAVTN